MAWQLPTRIESIVLSFALARLGTTQLPIIPIYREREVGSVIVQGGARFFAVPGTWRNFDYEAMAKGLQESTGEPFEILVVTADLQDGGLPEGDPSTLPAPPTDGDAGALALLDVGHHRGAQVRDALRRRADRRWARARVRDASRSPTTSARSRSRARTSAGPTTSW